MRQDRTGWGWTLQAFSAAVAVPVLLLGCGLFPREKGSPAPTLPEPPSVSASVTYPVQRTTIARMIEGSADVTPVRETALYFKESGRVKELTVEPGSKVNRGAVLAQLDIGDLEHQLRLARIDAEIARVTLESMRLRGATSFDLRIQQLVVDREEENISYLSSRVDAATVRAPYDGVVKSVLVQVSDKIQDYETVVELSDPSELELQTKVSENEFSEIYRGLEAQVQAGDGPWLPVTIVQTTHRDPAHDASVSRDEYGVHFPLPRRGIDTHQNNRVNYRIVLERRANALVIPLAGLREFQGRTYVRLLEGETRREADVRVGIRTDTQAEILEGLTDGQLVIGR